MKYAGIGSRETPESILEDMKYIAIRLAEVGYILRSGGAFGADTAFEIGCDEVNGAKEIFESKHATKEAIELALKFHPNPKALKRKGDFVLGLMGRNMQIISGKDLNDNVDFVVCWTKDGGPTGGTGQALRYVASLNIPVYNLFNETDVENLKQLLEQLEQLCKGLI